MRTALGYGPTETQQDAKIDQAIPEADAAIAAYTGRTFAVVASAVASARIFRTGNSGVIEIDDFKHGSVTRVRYVGQEVDLQPSHDYLAEPSSWEYPVAYWIELLYPGLVSSPKMGFTRNEDTIWREPRQVAGAEIEVTAVWGWPAVPADVKRAAIWTVSAFMERPTPYVSESIAGFSRTNANPMTHAIPRRAQAILDEHVKGTGGQ